MSSARFGSSVTLGGRPQSGTVICDARVTLGIADTVIDGGRGVFHAQTLLGMPHPLPASPPTVHPMQI